MTKRNSNFEENPPKKSKLVVDDLWGDDLNAEDIDDCLLRATQVYQQENNSQVNNVSILPSYDAFRQPTKFMFTSTQQSNSAKPNQIASTSRYNQNNGTTNNEEEYYFKRPRLQDNNQLQIKLDELQKELEVKNGENSILRSKLSSLQLSLRLEHEKKQKETNEKLQNVLKDFQACKSELEFKNLEIINLKHKIIELSKSGSVSNEILSSPHQKINTNADSGKPELHTYKTYVTLRPVENAKLPLKNKIHFSIFNMLNRKDAENKINMTDLSDKYINNISLDLVQTNLIFLINSTKEEINSESNFHHINKIIIILKHLLRNLNVFLEGMQRSTLSEDVRKRDMEYLDNKIYKVEITMSIFDSREWCENEIGTRIRQLLAFTSELLPISDYLRQIVIENKELICSKDAMDETYENIYNLNENVQNINVLHVILSCVTVIGAMRKSNNCVGFLCAVLTLLSKVYKTNHFDSNMNGVLENIIKEIIFGRPNCLVIHYISIFMVNASSNGYFINSMCNKSKKSLKKNSKNVLYFDSNACVFQVFNVVYKNSVLNGIENDLYINTNLNMLKFILNVFNNNKCEWIYYRENNQCHCLKNLNNLTFEIIYRLLKIYENNCSNGQLSGDSRLGEIVNHIMNLLHVLNFKNYDLIEKYLKASSHFKVTVHIMNKLRNYLKPEDSNLLDQLIMSEVVDMKISINEDNYDNIPFWK